MRMSVSRVKRAMNSSRSSLKSPVSTQPSQPQLPVDPRDDHRFSACFFRMKHDTPFKIVSLCYPPHIAPRSTNSFKLRALSRGRSGNRPQVRG